MCVRHSRWADAGTGEKALKGEIREAGVGVSVLYSCITTPKFSGLKQLTFIF